MEDKNFTIEISDFQFVRRGIQIKPALRFTVTWKFSHPQYGILGQSEEGWLATRTRGGDLRVSPPISRFGPSQSKQLKTITVDYFNLIKSIIINNRSKSGKSYADWVGSDFPEALRAQPAKDVDETLPEFLSV